MNRRRFIAASLTVLAASTAAHAHHGWGGYDANTVLTLTGTVTDMSYENPHGMLMLKMEDAGKTWTVTLSPPHRMKARGLPAEDIKAGATVTVVGYPSRSDPDEMRAERITVDGKTVELR